jgi:hypothetical protein
MNLGIIRASTGQHGGMVLGVNGNFGNIGAR